ncbi:hypothetical protein BDV96DRAFT_393250 [Lophiotrema nucula]|uniref:Uncharacterized protein n=1 Tax=Lophiotrema nucula TaxID=690887 RepID=A0A6A5ZFK7_9PLEO|nr:hypothetical protein BDV96DRAFT_393250 [Lophiotrema nucula]
MCSISNGSIDLVNRIGSIVDAERAWNDFLAQERQQPNHNASRYIRINPDLGEDPPKMDAKKEVEQLHRQTKRILATSRYKDTIKDVVLRLAASSFYFVKSSSTTIEHGQTHRIQGNICCRFEDGSRNLRRMGEFLRHQQKPASKPTFHIVNHENNTVIQRIELRSTVIANMLDRAVFAPEACEIDVPVPSAWVAITISLVNTNDIVDHYPISGFPRVLPDMPPRDRRPRASRKTTANVLRDRKARASTGAILETMTSAGPSQPRRNITVPAALSPRVELDSTRLLPNTASKSTASLDADSTTRASRVELASRPRAQELPSTLEPSRSHELSGSATERSSRTQDSSVRRQSEFAARGQENSDGGRRRRHRSHEHSQSLPEVPELESNQTTHPDRTARATVPSISRQRERMAAVQLDGNAQRASRAAQSASGGPSAHSRGTHRRQRDWRPEQPIQRNEADPPPTELPGDVRPRPRRLQSSTPRERDQPTTIPSYVPLSSIQPLSSVSSTVSERTESSSSPFAPQRTQAAGPSSGSTSNSSTTIGRETGTRVERRRSYISLSSPLQRLERRHRQPPPPPSWHGEYSDDDVESSVMS